MGSDPSSPDSFPTTQWSLVRLAQTGTPEEMSMVMEQLCRRYWRPIYRFLRNSGQSKADAEDLTQALFEKIIGEEAILEARRERGKLRSFMLGMLHRVISRERRHRSAAKRGGGGIAIPLEEIDDGHPPHPHLQDGDDPAKIFERQWAFQVMDHALGQLRAAFAENGRGDVFHAISPFLMPNAEPPTYRDLAATLASSEGAARQLLHRVRKKFRELLEEEISRTVMRPEDVEEEMRWLARMVATAR